MSDHLILITEEDLPEITQRCNEILDEYGYSCTVTLAPEYESSRNRVTIHTKVPNGKLSILKQIADLEYAFAGEANWEIEALCECGEPAFVYFYGDDPDEFDPCICRKCSNKKFLDENKSHCRLCGKEYEQYSDSGESWRTRLEAYVIDDIMAEKIKAELIKNDPGENLSHTDATAQADKSAVINVIDFDIHSTNVMDWNLCSRECAKKVYAKWFREVANHPFTKECLESTNES